ncbi:hypothetical protein GGR53DRAFT_42102 [Hypoxylon sp. FL1150]|nr:hypothetical protein GGR53DRAFT_42102 [Hypoxylon sp. FL1150]
MIEVVLLIVALIDDTWTARKVTTAAIMPLQGLGRFPSRTWGTRNESWLSDEPPMSSLQRNPTHARDGASDTIQMDISRFSRCVLAQSVFTGADNFIDFLSTLAVIFVIVNLAAVTIPWYICIPAWSMVIG